MEAKMVIYNSTIGIQIFNYKHYLKNKFTVQKGKKQQYIISITKNGKMDIIE